MSEEPMIYTSPKRDSLWRYTTLYEGQAEPPQLTCMGVLTILFGRNIAVVLGPVKACSRELLAHISIMGV